MLDIIMWWCGICTTFYVLGCLLTPDEPGLIRGEGMDHD